MPFQNKIMMDTREKILKISSKTMQSVGIKNLRVDEISKSLNISKRTLYELFSNKRNLVKETLFYMYSEFNKKMLEMIDKSENMIEAIDKIHRFEIKMLKNISENVLDEIRDYSFQFNISNFQMKKQSSDPWAGYIIFEKGVAQGIFRDNLNIDAVLIFLDEIHVLIHKKNIFGNLKCTSDEVKKSIIEPYFRGLCTEKGVKILEKYYCKS